jgi:hypothetical protein
MFAIHHPSFNVNPDELPATHSGDPPFSDLGSNAHPAQSGESSVTNLDSGSLLLAVDPTVDGTLSDSDASTRNDTGSGSCVPFIGGQAEYYELYGYPDDYRDYSFTGVESSASIHSLAHSEDTAPATVLPVPAHIESVSYMLMHSVLMLIKHRRAQSSILTKPSRSRLVVNKTPKSHLIVNRASRCHLYLL